MERYRETDSNWTVPRSERYQNNVAPVVDTVCAQRRLWRSNRCLHTDKLSRCRSKRRMMVPVANAEQAEE
jgi:hypothetical protein